jgi:2-phosphosulfolactate phosphatase
MRQLRGHYLPESVAAEPESLAAEHIEHGTAVVIDVLRATTTIVFALSAGARAVVPCLTIEEARATAEALSADGVVLGGERGGRPIEGFDLGNSPAEYVPRTVGGKTIVLTTTNGTKALLQCAGAERIVIGSFVNLSALCAVLSGGQSIDLVCAGTDGQVTREDVLLAGAIADRLTFEQPSAQPVWELNGEAHAARDAWLALVAGATGGELTARLIEAMRASRGGENLIALGMSGDIELAAQIDRFAIVPQFDPASGRIESDTAPGHMA